MRLSNKNCRLYPTTSVTWTVFLQLFPLIQLCWNEQMQLHDGILDRWSTVKRAVLQIPSLLRACCTSFFHFNFLFLSSFSSCSVSFLFCMYFLLCNNFLSLSLITLYLLVPDWLRTSSCFQFLVVIQNGVETWRSTQHIESTFCHLPLNLVMFTVYSLIMI